MESNNSRIDCGKEPEWRSRMVLNSKRPRNKANSIIRKICSLSRSLRFLRRILVSFLRSCNSRKMPFEANSSIKNLKMTITKIPRSLNYNIKIIKYNYSKHSGLMDPIPRTTESAMSVASHRILKRMII